jgi:hypothetical protein
MIHLLWPFGGTFFSLNSGFGVNYANDAKERI